MRPPRRHSTRLAELEQRLTPLPAPALCATCHRPTSHGVATEDRKTVVARILAKLDRLAGTVPPSAEPFVWPRCATCGHLHFHREQ